MKNNIKLLDVVALIEDLWGAPLSCYFFTNFHQCR